MVLTIDQVAAHLRDDVTDADALALLNMFARAAFTHVNNVTGQSYAGVDDALPDVPEPVAAAVLLIVGDLWEHRTGQVDMKLYENVAVDRLLLPYRVWQ